MNAILKLAKNATEQFVRDQTIAQLPEVLPTELYSQAACYVTVFENPGKRHRATYGSPLPRQINLAQEIIFNAIDMVRNSGYRPMRRIDLPSFIYSVAILGPLQRISSPHHLDPTQFGLYVYADNGKSTVILPRRIGVENANDQIATAIREAGINKDTDQPSLYRFPVTFVE